MSLNLFLFVIDWEKCDQIGQNFVVWVPLIDHFYNFTLISITHFNVQKQLVVNVLDFKFDFWQIGYSFGHIHKNWVIFYQSSGHSDWEANCTKLIILGPDFWEEGWSLHEF